VDATIAPAVVDGLKGRANRATGKPHLTLIDGGA